MNLADPSRTHNRLLKPGPYPDSYILELDNTSLSTFTKCPREFEFYKIYGRESNGERSALFYGEGIHAGLETFYKLGSHTDGTTILEGLDFSSRRQAAFDALQTHWTKKDFDTFDDWRTLDHAIENLTLYFKRYEQSNDYPLSHAGHPFVEIPFSVPLETYSPKVEVCYPRHMLVEGAEPTLDPTFHLDSLEVRWTGKIDMISILENSGSFQQVAWVQDHKTTSIAGETFWTQFELSAQMRGYVYAAMVSPDIQLPVPLGGVCVNALIGRKKTKTGVAFEHERRFFPVTPESLDEWKRDTLSHINTVVNALASGRFPQTPNACVHKYGICPYHDVCKRSLDERLSFLGTSYYKDVTWSPLTSGK